MEYKENINSGIYIKIVNKENEGLFEMMEIPKNIEYVYSSYPYKFTIEFIEKEKLNTMRALKTSETNEITDSIYTSISQKIKENDIKDSTETTLIHSKEENEERENISNNLKSSIIFIWFLNIILF